MKTIALLIMINSYFLSEQMKEKNELYPFAILISSGVLIIIRYVL